MLTEGLRAEVARLKAERDAAVLAHYYVPPEVQELADHVGDSFALARLAATLPCRTLVFAGVRFMAESAKLLSPDKTVLMPDPAADCPMAHMVRHETVVAARARYGDDLAVACYVNSTAEAKSWSDVCVTSSNAVRIVRALPQKNVLFIPDRHLGSYVARQVGEKNVLLNDGCCPIHQAISADEVRALKEAFPEAPVLAHPECGPEVMALADVAGSTSQIIEAAVAGTARDYIVLTVDGVRGELERRCAGTDKRFHFPATRPACPDMDRITAERLVACLREGTGEVGLPPVEVADGARAALTRMLELGAR
ncbi:quinolinate synthase NadA [Olsenella uli]|uniref:quinolinate synthase NadA n=1 Tax=Olsenella uli TaxID=133926 RepID=UPI00195629E7|nr:quinolinate synthase NadA [Olsenella uli]MBM6675944.1 quinolinate synthase NadA [Olsenella uli]